MQAIEAGDKRLKPNMSIKQSSMTGFHQFVELFEINYFSYLIGLNCKMSLRYEEKLTCNTPQPPSSQCGADGGNLCVASEDQLEAGDYETQAPYEPRAPDGGVSAWLALLGSWCMLFCTFGLINCNKKHCSNQFTPYPFTNHFKVLALFKGIMSKFCSKVMRPVQSHGFHLCKYSLHT